MLLLCKKKECLDTLISVAECVGSALSLGQEIKSKLLDSANNGLQAIFESIRDPDIEIQSNIELLKYLILRNEIDIEAIEKIIEKLYLIIDSIEEKKIKIVFMPYKAEMWDSLSSVYRYSLGCESVDTELIPVPFYSLGNERAKTKINYEYDFFQPMKGFHSYQRMADEDYFGDVLFVHNIFDGMNSLTEIDERFYLKKLRKKFRYIVYVPYFISGSYANVKSFAQTHIYPTLFLVDKIILQNKTQANAYEYCGISKERLMIKGSPKIDYLINYQIEIESEMFKWVEEQKQQKKRIVLVNSTITSYLSNSRYFEDLLENFKKFESMNGYAFIWRPHPLFNSLVNSDVKQHDRFSSIVQFVSKTTSMYFDESKNAAESMRLSDCLISDHSSIVRQYAAMGKPIIVYGKFNSDYSSRLNIFDFSTCRFIDRDFLNIKEQLESQDFWRLHDKTIINDCLTNTAGTVGEDIFISCLKEFGLD